MVKTSKDKTISIRLSQAMLEAIDARAILDEKDRTQVIREAIAEYLELEEDSVEEQVYFLQDRVESLRAESQKEKKRTDLLEKRVDELRHLITICIERLK